MIFGRKKRQAEADSSPEVTEEVSQVHTEPTEDEVAEAAAVDSKVATEHSDSDELVIEDGLDDADGDAVEEADEEADEDGTEEADPEIEVDVEFLDAQEWRSDGPWDDSEIDMEEFVSALDVPRIDLGSLILTGTEGMDVQLQVAEDTQQIVSAMMLLGEQVEVDGEIHELGSALEVAAFAAPRSGGFWSEIREELIESAEEAGGNAGLVEGPFGVEVRRLLLVDTPDGEQGYQPSRMWVAEGPRWILRGVVYGHAALEGVPGGHAERIVDLFRQIVVRRGDDPMAPGDLLTLELPENMEEEAEAAAEES